MNAQFCEDEKMENYMTVSAVARLAKKSEGWVRQVEMRGKLPALRTSTGQRIFRESDVIAFLKKRGESLERLSA
jgi:hypothetical protein